MENKNVKFTTLYQLDEQEKNALLDKYAPQKPKENLEYIPSDNQSSYFQQSMSDFNNAIKKIIGKYSGKKLDGRYEINEQIYTDYVSDFYSAYDTTEDKNVQIRIFKDEFLGNEDFIKKFKHLTELSHPNIMKIYDFCLGDRIQYIVTECMKPITLKEYIANNNNIPWKESVYITIQILNAFKYAHSKNIIHGNLNPENVIISKDGTVKVTGFSMDCSLDIKTIIDDNKANYSLNYKALEQIKGNEPDIRSDIYSVGVIFYEMLTGKLPFESDVKTLLLMILLENKSTLALDLNKVPKRFKEVILKSMDKASYKRFQTADEMIELIKVCSMIQFNSISANSYHTVACKSDGTAVATGYSIDGQCNVKEWTNIVAVSAGREHTVGLRSDGTVITAGKNKKGCCDVNGVKSVFGKIKKVAWSNIVAISAGNNYTVGLKSDGTVVATGKNNDGQCNVENWTNIVAISAGYSHTVGLKSDGTVVATGAGHNNISGWKDIVAISAGFWHTVGLKSDGTVIATGYSLDGQCNVENWTNIVAISAGREYTVGLRSDGTVITAGKNNVGQCNVENWTNINIPEISNVSTSDFVSEKKQDISPVLETDAKNFEFTEDSTGNIVITKYIGKDTNVVIPKKINGKNVTKIGDGAFKDCISLTSITIPDGVTKIGDYAFNFCFSLTSITIPDGVTKIGDYAFCGCNSLTSITIPDGVTQIGNYAFYDCNSLASITIPNGVTKIGDDAFCYCGNLTSITIPDGVTKIGDGAFRWCNSLTSITIPDGVTQIGDGAFCRCDSLTSITIPDGVTKIGDGAFFGCKSLTSITIPDGVTQIGSDAFGYCPNLTIYGKMFSYAEKYAKQNNIKFKNY